MKSSTQRTPGKQAKAGKLILSMQKAAHQYIQATIRGEKVEAAKRKLDARVTAVFAAIEGRSPTQQEVEECRGW